jgi:cysteine-S-conjugate beta-lyase
MIYDFDHVIDRRTTDSVKWQKYGQEVIPLWVADMDFAACDSVLKALCDRVDQGILGYSAPPPELRPVIQERLKRLYEWSVREEEIVFVPGVVTGLSLAFMSCTAPSEGVLAQPPVYFHFLDDPVLRGRILNDPPLVKAGDTYEIDFDAFERAITGTTRIFLLCNPHNPVGRVFSRMELTRLADICLRHNVVVCSDEIHCDILYPGYRHLPIASLSPEIAENSITLMAPSKTFNVAGLGCAFAVIRNQGLRNKWNEWARGLVPGVNVLGYAGALGAYQGGQEWLDQLLMYLDDSRRFLAEFVREKMPSVQLSKIEATYLGWLDCRNTGIEGNPHRFFLDKAKVALNDGKEFGKGGEGFVRINFGCPRRTLTEALNRMAEALNRV